jgi:hypothetical protein
MYSAPGIIAWLTEAVNLTMGEGEVVRGVRTQQAAPTGKKTALASILILGSG